MPVSVGVLLLSLLLLLLMVMMLCLRVVCSLFAVAAVAASARTPVKPRRDQAGAGECSLLPRICHVFLLCLRCMYKSVACWLNHDRFNLQPAAAAATWCWVVLRPPALHCVFFTHRVGRS